MNKSLTKLYQLHNQPSASSTITSTQRGDNMVALTAGSPARDDGDKKHTLTSCSSNLDNNSRTEPHVDDHQKIKETIQLVVSC